MHNALPVLLVLLVAACAPQAVAVPTAAPPLPTATLPAPMPSALAAQYVYAQQTAAAAMQTQAAIAGQVAQATADAAATRDAWSWSVTQTAAAMQAEQTAQAMRATDRAGEITATAQARVMASDATAQAIAVQSTVSAATVTAEALASERARAAEVESRDRSIDNFGAFAWIAVRTVAGIIFIIFLWYVLFGPVMDLFEALAARRRLAPVGGGGMAELIDGRYQIITAPRALLTASGDYDNDEPEGQFTVTDRSGTRAYAPVDDAAREREALRQLCLRLVRVSRKIRGGHSHDLPTADELAAAGLHPATRQDAIDALRHVLEIKRGRDGYTRVARGATLDDLHAALMAGDVVPALPAPAGGGSAQTPQSEPLSETKLKAAAEDLREVFQMHARETTEDREARVSRQLRAGV